MCHCRWGAQVSRRRCGKETWQGNSTCGRYVESSGGCCEAAQHGKTYEQLDERLREFIARQHVFFVATAPLAPDGHVNVSPKGLDSFRVLSPQSLAYLDLTGSGVETIAHLRENGRITLMFCAFEGPPKILRLHGRGRVVLPGEPEFLLRRPLFPSYPGVRAIIVVELERISDSCGYGVPLCDYRGERRQWSDWSARKGEEGLQLYQAQNNQKSIDGLPGLPTRLQER